MHLHHIRLPRLLSAAVVISLAAGCQNLEVPNYNNPSLDQAKLNPTNIEAQSGTAFKYMFTVMQGSDVRNGTKELLTRNPWTMLPFVSQFLARPRWLSGCVRDGGLMTFPNVMLADRGPMPYADVGAMLEQSMVSWADLKWIRDAWSGPIVIKGVHIGDDARRAVDEGAEAIVVSNHGGRQLDGVAATLRVLPEVIAAVGGRTEVLLDGGIRRGSDIVKALCLGARAVLIGRAYAYGLGAGGGPGVARAIEILRSDLVRTLKLLGCASIDELNASYVEAPAEWTRG